MRTINQLWLHYSDGKFGFSVQKEIYESLGGTEEYNEQVWRNFCDRIGWRKEGKYIMYSDLTFNLKAPQAHLPYVAVDLVWRPRGIGGGLTWESYLFSRSLAQRLVT